MKKCKHCGGEMTKSNSIKYCSTKCSYEVMAIKAKERKQITLVKIKGWGLLENGTISTSSSERGNIRYLSENREKYGVKTKVVPITIIYKIKK